MEDHNLSIPTVPQWIGMPLFLFVKLSWKYVISKVYIEAKLIFYGTWFMFPTYRHFFFYNFYCSLLMSLNSIVRHIEEEKL